MGTWGPASDLGYEPQDWWGPFGSRGPRLSVVDLVAGRIATPDQAALLWSTVATGGSLTVAAGPSGAGKTTTLTAFLDAIPPGRRRVYIRGMYETFAFRRELRPEAAALLVNEISGHLPIYCWGDAVRGLLQSAREGYQVLATTHAVTIEEAVQTLAARPLRMPLELVAQLGLVALLDAWREPDGRVVRRVREIVRLGYDGERHALTLERPPQQVAGDLQPLRDAIARLAAGSERPDAARLRILLAV